ncbi:hypothetical protein SLE2022_190870 [Rubroshorea leprosula]
MNAPTFLILAIFLCLFLPFSSQIKAESDLIKQVCSQTTNPSLCTTTLVSNPKAASATNFVTLCKAALGSVIINAIDLLSYVDNALFNDPKPELKEALETCVKQYNYAKGSLESSYMEIDLDPLTANYDAKVAGDGYTYCEEALARTKVGDPKISAKNKVGLDFVSIADSATSKLPN